MDTRFLESLLAVVENGSIADAARHQGLTAAAVRQRLMALETMVQVPLFQRVGKTVKPTEACLRILPDAKRIVDGASLLQARIGDAELNGVLKIGAIVTSMATVMADALERLQSSAPGLEPEIHPGTSPQLYERLLSGELDLALLIEPPFALSKELVRYDIRQEPLMLLAPKGSAQPVDRLLMKHPYIRYDPNSWGGMRAEKYISDRGLSPKIFCTIDALESLPYFVGRGLGVALTPDWGGRWPDDLNVVGRRIKDPEYSRPIVVLHKRSPTKERAVNAFLDSLGLAGLP